MHQQKTFDFESSQNAAGTPPEPTPDAAALPPALIRPDRQILYPEAVTHYDWPDPAELHDRDTITVDRIVDDIDGPAHRFVIKRGDTVEAYISKDKFHVGQVIGISHARGEVHVAWDDTLKKGGWWKVGAIYPAPEPEPKTSQTTQPLSKTIDQLNQQNAPPDGFTATEKVPRSYTFKEFKELLATPREQFSYQQYRETFERVASSEAAIKQELVTSYNARQLKNIANNLRSWDANRCTKAMNAQNIYDKMLSYFLLDGIVSFPMGESYLDAVKKKVRAVTEQDWNAHHERIAAKRAEHQQAIENPQTLLDFAKFIEAESVEAMSNEQMARWDSLHADLARERRAANGPASTVSQFESEALSEVEFTMKEGYHDKQKCPLWIVQLGSRVETSAFRELKVKAKMLGGWWSSFKKADAGFQFRDRDAAQRFTALLSSDADREDILARRQEKKGQTAAERLHELADALLARAEETIEASNNSLQNTARRADIQAGVRGRAFADQALARSLHTVATALSTGTSKYLDGIRHKTHLETLDLVLYQAKHTRIRAIRNAKNEADYGFGLRVQEEEEKPYSHDDIRFAEYPHPYAYRSWLQQAIAHCQTQRGAKQAAAKMAKLLHRSSAERIDFTNQYDIETFADFVSRAQAVGFDTRWLHTGLEPYKRLRAAKLDDLHELRAALREYLPHKASVRRDDPVRVAERELIGKDLPGFFPTPPAVIDQLLDYAQIEDGMRVLEPSCGKGDIVTAITQRHPDVKLTAIEKNLALADVLAAQGIACEFKDFFSEESHYDRIVMNPPFERGQDIDHVMYAHQLLAPAGKLVAVMSEGPFFRTEGESVEFRKWLEQQSGESYPLPADAFSSAEAFRKTGVRTRIVVIDKVASQAYALSVSMDLTKNALPEISESSLHGMRRSICEAIEARGIAKVTGSGVGLGQLDISVTTTDVEKTKKQITELAQEFSLPAVEFSSSPLEINPTP